MTPAVRPMDDLTCTLSDYCSGFSHDETPLREPAWQELSLLSVQKSPYKLNVLFKKFEMRSSASARVDQLLVLRRCPFALKADVRRLTG